MENNYTLYKHTSPSGKVYIGITSRKPEKRWGKDGGKYQSSPRFYAAIQKYGWGNIKHEILIVGLSKDEAAAKEKEMIELYNSTDRTCGYNQTYGGEFGPKITPEIKQRISESNRRYYSNQDVRERMRIANTGYKHTEAAKKKMSESHKGLTHIITDECRKKLSESLKRHYNSPENREKHKEDFKRIADVGRKKSKKVEQIDDSGNVVAVYESAKEAFRKTGIRDGNISKCCRGKVKHAGGYCWRYAS